MAAGEPLERGGDLFGAAVQLAARLCAHAGPGEVLVAGVVRDLAIGKAFGFAPAERVRLKGFPDPVTAHRLLAAAERGGS